MNMAVQENHFGEYHGYVDNVLEKVTNEQFQLLFDGYKPEQKTIKARLEQLTAEIENLKLLRPMWIAS